MKSTDMIRMANQIATYFKSYPHDEAVAETAGHIVRLGREQSIVGCPT